MIEIIKEKLWEFLQTKYISLVILFDNSGDIVWNKGRSIIGNNVISGEGFAQSYILKCLRDSKEVNEKDVVTVECQGSPSASAEKLFLKNIMVIPLANGYFLYIDSGIKKGFSESDQYFIKTIGSILKEIISSVKNKDTGFSWMCSEKMVRIRDLILKFSFHKQPVLLLGETGVGKTYIAEYIHKYSGRKGAFVNADITTLNESLFESIFFGHKKGSFTDAQEDKKGLVEEAEGGTLFIDEISEVPLSFQSKLLRFIDKNTYRVLGETEEKIANVRIVAATNKNINQLITNNNFKEDLYYRISVFEITIPPLRDRKEDIRIFIETNKHLISDKTLTEDFYSEIINYNWPGNIRELKTMLIRAGVLLESPITGSKIKPIINELNKKSRNNINESTSIRIWAELSSGKSFWDVVKIPFLNRDLNRKEVAEILERGLAENSHSYKKMMGSFNIETKEYKKFMNFLMVHKLSG